MNNEDQVPERPSNSLSGPLPDRNPQASEHGPLVSVVIPAYNAEKTIAECLKSVKEQRGNFSVELIVVDDGSTDRTGEIIKDVPGVVYLRQNNAGPAAARNKGLARSRAGIVFFTDADCVACPDWIEKSLPHFSDPAVGVVSGSYDISNPGSRLAKCIHREILYRHHHLMPRYPQYFGSFNFAVRREVFESVGGFDMRYRQASGEDNDLSYKILRAGHRIYFEKDSRVMHRHTVGLKKYLAEQFRHGFWRVRMYRDHPHMMRGDDYTFYKDIMEPAICLGAMLWLPVVAWDPGQFLGWIGLNFLLFLFEVWGAFVMGQEPSDGLFWGAVTFLRSYSRTIGFVSGLTMNWTHFSSKKIK